MNLENFNRIDKKDVLWWYISYYWDFNQSGIVKYKNKKYLASLMTQEREDPLIWGIYDVPENIMNNIWKFKNTVEMDGIGFLWTILDDDGNPLTSQQQKTRRPNPDNISLYQEIQNASQLCAKHGKLIGFVQEYIDEYNNAENEYDTFRKPRNYIGRF